MSQPKETGFFFNECDKEVDVFLDKYFPHFDGEEAIGEASTGNMVRYEAPSQIQNHFPESQLIFILRDPVERIWSAYKHGIIKGQLPPKPTESKLKSGFSKLIRDQASQWREKNIERGKYWNKLVRYEEHFSRNQMKIILFDEFIDNTESSMRSLFEFIGVNPCVEINTDKRYNESSPIANRGLYWTLYTVWIPLKRILPKTFLETLSGPVSAVRRWFRQKGEKNTFPSMAETDQQYLSSLYNMPNTRLEEWLERDLSHWT